MAKIFYRITLKRNQRWILVLEVLKYFDDIFALATAMMIPKQNFDSFWIFFDDLVDLESR